MPGRDLPKPSKICRSDFAKLAAFARGMWPSTFAASFQLQESGGVRFAAQRYRGLLCRALRLSVFALGACHAWVLSHYSAHKNHRGCLGSSLVSADVLAAVFV